MSVAVNTMPARQEVDLTPLTVSVVSTFPPTRCGIGRFSESLCRAWDLVAPELDVRRVRIISGTESALAGPQSDTVFHPESPVALRLAARRINQGQIALLQHEYGIYGRDDGIAVLDLVDRIEIPLLTVLHTVLARPSGRQHMIVERLAAAGTVVVPSSAAVDVLQASYGIGPGDVHVIPHGSWWTPPDQTHVHSRKLVTWGLLGPGKGIERALEALALLDPSVTYDIIGQTHPQIISTQGQAYRDSLLEATQHLSLDDRVNFIDRYLDDRQLVPLVASADVVLIPYDNDEQICSGVLTDALALGKPVVATDFPHARRLLADGAGVVVDHTPGALAAGIERLLNDESAYADATAAARRLSPDLSWHRVSHRYLAVMRKELDRVGVA